MKRERNGEECYGGEKNKRLAKIKKKREPGNGLEGERNVVQIQ